MAQNCHSDIGLSAMHLLTSTKKSLSAKEIQRYVPTTEAKFTDNKSEVAKADFAAGTPAPKADPTQGEGAYIFKIVSASNTIYGMLKVTSVVPGKSVSLDYKIGDMYAHLSILK